MGGGRLFPGPSGGGVQGWEGQGRASCGLAWSWDLGVHSVVLWLSRNVTARPQIGKSPPSPAAPSRLSGHDPTPTGRVTRSWGGARRPGVSVHVSCTDPSDPTTFPSSGWPPFTISQRDRDLGRRSSCRFKEGAQGVSGGRAAPASPGEAPLFSRPLPPKAPPSPSLTCLTLTHALPWRLRGRGTRRGPVAGGEGTRPGSAAFFSFPPCSPLCYVSVTLRCEKTKTNKPNTRNTNNQKITFTSEAPGPPSGAAEVGQRVGSGAR